MSRVVGVGFLLMLCLVVPVSANQIDQEMVPISGLILTGIGLMYLVAVLATVGAAIYAVYELIPGRGNNVGGGVIGIVGVIIGATFLFVILPRVTQAGLAAASTL